MDESDRTDLDQAVRGDAEAYRRIVLRYQGDVTRWMWRFTRDRNKLEELVQEVFVEAYFSARGYRGRGEFPAWLRRIATRVGYRHWKQEARRKAEKELALENWDGAEDRGASASDESELARTLLEKLPPRDRLVLTLQYLEEKSVSETADILGWSRTMVKVQVHRARKKLRQLMREAGLIEEDDQ